ncbi:unnamed protein product [Sphagnum troendelagicum]|uniref:Uncharacterized protein n=1 Tax=Sphagnum troendelagicum TaxID=128251 RepID=A0ABP0US84_9BRYO
MAECNSFCQVFQERCPGVKIRVDDIKNLVDVGYDTETALAAASKDSLDKILPNQPSVVYALIKAFSQPAEGEPPSKKAKWSPDEHQSLDPVNQIESKVAARYGYFKKLLEAPLELPKTNPGTSETTSQALLPLLRPDFQLFVRNVLLLRWENKIDKADLDLEPAGRNGEEWEGDGLTAWDESTLKDRDGKKIYIKASDMLKLGKLIVEATYSGHSEEDSDLYPMGEKMQWERLEQRRCLRISVSMVVNVVASLTLR